MTKEPKEIRVENNVIGNRTIVFEDYGVEVLSGDNGTGKSLLLEAVKTVARGKGRIPVRDGAEEATVEAFGARMTIGAKARHAGQFDVVHLEGRFDLAKLVDPDIKDPAAADRRRIKELVGLTGAVASRDLFLEEEEFADYTSVVPTSAEDTDDLVEMARRVKAAYDAAALEHERSAERLDASANAIRPTPDDLAGESDQKTLSKAYDKARDRYNELLHASRESVRSANRRKEAQEKLDRIVGEYDGAASTVAHEEYEARVAEEKQIGAEIEELEKRLAELLTREANAQGKTNVAKEKWSAAVRHEQAVDALKQTIASDVSDPVPDTELEAAEASLKEATEAVDRGALVREAKRKQDEANDMVRRAEQAKETAERLREAAQSTERVLSNAIKTDRILVRHVDDETRLMVEHARRNRLVPYHELSHGERWAIAIDLAADKVGEDGLIVIEQEGWEGLDVHNRRAIRQHAKQRKVYILTVEATRGDWESDFEEAASPQGSRT